MATTRRSRVLLGRGGYGKVLSAGSGRAEKIQDPHHSDLGVPCSALRELTCLVSLDDPRTTPKLYATSIDASARVKFTMPQFAQTVLDAQKRVKDKVLPEELSKAILRDVCAALASAHARGIMHRDIKPENIMLRDFAVVDLADTARVIDWGMARVATTRAPTHWTPNVTTLWYRAPEVLLNEPYTHAIDMWSVGVLAIELLTGRCAFRGSRSVDCLRTIIQILGPPPKGVFARWDTWARRLHLEATVRQESSRTRVWSLGSAYRISSVAADFIDRCLRWTPRARMTAHDALNHPYLSSVSKALQIQSSLPFTRVLSGARPATFSVTPTCAHYLDRIIFRLVMRYRLMEGVEWTAALLLLRCIQAQVNLTEDLAYTCLDVANKLVGTQHCDVLRRVGVTDAKDATAILLRDVLGLDNLYLFLSPLYELRCQSAETRLRRYPAAPRAWTWAYAYARAFVDAVLVTPSRDGGAVACPDVLARSAWTMSAYVTGVVRMDEVVAAKTTYPGSKYAVSCICHAWNVVTTSSEVGMHWRDMHARVLADQVRDKQRRRRVLEFVAAVDQTSPDRRRDTILRSH